MHTDCIFCKIANKEIPTKFVYEDESVAAFKDLEPQAPVHVLVVSKKHIANLLDVAASDQDLLAHIMGEVIPKIAKDLGVDEKGFRVVVNTKADGGQTVPHLHFHLLGGRSMTWPPG
jgi:histidine triad (HIT) family protein